MRVLVIGSGGREHALAARLMAERDVTAIHCAPGNPGMAAIARTSPLDLRRPDDAVALVEQHGIDLTIVGPELPLSLGVVDRLVEHGHLAFGPTAAAARLESSKAFAKAFMARHQVPTARFSVAASAADARATLRSGEFGFPVVLKADGLAAGKGVVIAGNLVDAEAAVAMAMEDRRFGAAGARLVIEECLSGPEVSFFVVADGQRAVAIGAAQDHKRIFDDDRGANTGGMGAFAPSPLVDPPLHDRIMNEIVGPVLGGMASEGYPFQGFLYVGLMLTPAGPKVIEFNVRLGDPEAQVVLPRVDAPLAALLLAAANGELRQVSCQLSAECLVGVVVASHGYPESSRSGDVITGIEQAERMPGVSVLHAGTAIRNGDLVTAGGRVLTVLGRGATFETAIERAYAGVEQVSFAGMQYRRDIGKKALDRR